jgi:hypothetical protein
VAAEWLVAAGTLALAGATYVLVRVTRRMVAQAGEQVMLEQRRVEASQRPHVFPAASRRWIEGADLPGGMQWLELLPVTNGGPGLAINVRGTLYFAGPGGVSVELVPTSLAPGESEYMRINWGGPPITQWADARGFLLYDDIAGETWRTDYVVRAVNRRYLEVLQTGRLRDLGDVERDFPPARLAE